jgi:hypothetical protein
MKVINWFGGPHSGKSTQAAGLFHLMKSDGLSVELVNEYAKMKVWEGHIDILQDQLYMLAKQNRRQMRLDGQVEYCVTDSPLILSAVYRNAYTNTLYTEQLDHITLECFERFDNYNIYLERDPDYYERDGRAQDLDGALRIDEYMLELLNKWGIPYVSVPVGVATVPLMYKYIQKHYNDQ